MGKPHRKESQAKSRDFLNWITTFRCVACGSPGQIHEDATYRTAPAHIKSRGSGGEDIGNVVPLCYRCHTQQHTQGWATFKKACNLNPRAIAEKFAQEWIAKTEKER